MDAASAVVAELDHGAFREHLIASLVKEYASSSPEEGLRWFADHPMHSGSGNRRALSALAAAFVSSSPQDGIAKSKTLSNQAQERFFSDKLGRRWVVDSAGEAQSWMMAELRAGRLDESRSAIEGIIAESVRINNTEIFSLMDQIDEASIKRDLTRSAAVALAEFNPSLAMEKLFQGLDQNLQSDTRSVAEVTSRWLGADPLAATRWVDQLEKGQARDAAVERVVENIISVEGDAEAAGNWAATISDKELREKLLEKIK
jgi:uncharacterized protein (DUF1810 family)